MILKNKDGREVEVETEANNDGSRYFTYGAYVDTGVELDDNELDELTDQYPDVLDEIAFESAIEKAESFYEGDR